MTEPDRGESYLEIQMDRSTILLAALGILACMVVAFLLGSWTGSRKASADQALATATAEASGAAGADVDATEQDVDAEPSFGGRPVSASGAAPLTAVPAPARVASAPSRPKGSSGITVASDGDDVSVETVEVAPPPTAKPSTKTAAKTSASAKTTPSKTASAPSVSGWVVQVAAVKERLEAEALKKKLEAKGYPVRLLDEGGFLKVQVGPFAAKSDALSAEQRLKGERGLSTWVKKA